MNDRIKELAEKAGFILWGEEIWNPGDAIDWSSGYDAELTKLVELIVNECAAEADKQTIYCRGIPWGRWLKEHFGVEDAKID